MQYNNNMTTVIIEGPEKAIFAGTWAEKNIKNNWHLDVREPFANRYHFVFSDSKDATFFSLRWKQ